jgi:thioredoxin reductase
MNATNPPNDRSVMSDPKTFDDVSEHGDEYDVVVIGGSAAGLSGAKALGRSRRSVLVVDAGEPRNAPAAHVHNYLGRESAAPRDLVAIGRAEVAEYGVEVVDGAVTGVTRDGDRFRVTLAPLGRVPGVVLGATPGVVLGATEAGAPGVAPVHRERTVLARRVLLASGSRDELPDVPGVREQWGRGVVHCPYCHGWEVRDRAIGVLATSAFAAHHVDMFRQLSDRVTLFLNDSFEPTDEQWEAFAARDVQVVAGRVVELVSRRASGTESRSGSGTVVESGTGFGTASGSVFESESVSGTESGAVSRSEAEPVSRSGYGSAPATGEVAGVRLASGTLIPVDVLATATRVHARADVVRPLGIVPEPVERDDVVLGSIVPVDPAGQTTAAGVYAAGNVTDVTMQVVTSAAAGMKAGASINADLIAEDTRIAVRARATRTPATAHPA